VGVAGTGQEGPGVVADEVLPAVSEVASVLELIL
jgi:hypothetical protein